MDCFGNRDGKVVSKAFPFQSDHSSRKRAFQGLKNANHPQKTLIGVLYLTTLRRRNRSGKIS